MKKRRLAAQGPAVLLLAALLLAACGGCAGKGRPDAVKPTRRALAMMGYTIQAGAFAQAENAVRFTQKLKTQGLDATYFKAKDGLFKVRFGNYSVKEQARQRALALRKAGVIEEFYIVVPEEYAAARRDAAYLRRSLVQTARDFIGVPYLWGGSSSETGFDCSGLTMTVYQLNGLDLPRHSAAQYDAGESIDRGDLKEGDLVFFRVKGRGKVSHVGIYIGDGKFIHAPSRGKKIGVDSLADGYYARHYVGAKNYL
ncbi:MAG: NlpC/P60 family protein [Smithellaceae bacterium]|nr:C40 family peptidase [Syntrophaceae bacterium]MDD4241024.1 NlpC/P60 family protein [Smithellaceae bacterium]